MYSAYLPLTESQRSSKNTFELLEKQLLVSSVVNQP